MPLEPITSSRAFTWSVETRPARPSGTRRAIQTATRGLNLSDGDRDLWNFRLQSAKARIAAREGKAAEANTDLASAKALLDSGKVPANQQVFLPYLNGYVAFYAKDYKTAIDQFLKADQKDPFVLVMIAQAYDQLGNQAEATKYYRDVLTFNTHNPTNAFARPLAKKKLETAAK